MKRGFACILLAVLLAALAAVPALADTYNNYGGYYTPFGGGYGGGSYWPYGNGGSNGFGYPFGNGNGGNNGNGYFFNPFGSEDGQQNPSGVTETTLRAMPSSRTVKSGDTLQLDYDLLLSDGDQSRVEVIEQGTTLEYILVTAPVDNEEQTTESAPQTVTFSMNRRNNERCSITITPTVTQNSVLKVKAKMTFTDGAVLENESDKILVYTDAAVSSHAGVQSCQPGATVEYSFMLIGPEGPWQFTFYMATSSDNGATYTRTGSTMNIQVNTRQTEPKTSLNVVAPSAENTYFRLEAEITLPDGTRITHVCDPVLVGVAAAAI